LARTKSDLATRLLIAALLIPLVLFFLYKGGWWFFGFVLTMVTLATFEYVLMLRHLGHRPFPVFALGLAWAILVDFFLPGPAYLRPVVAALLFASLSWQVLRGQARTPTEDWLLPLAGALYVGWTAGHFLLLRALPRGEVLVFITVALTALADTGAYFVGRTWGKRRLAPRLSPGKTWEGYAGGVVVALAAGPLLTGLTGLGWIHGLILGLLLSTLTPVGDLGVSMIKRQAGVKDSGKLFPGHGGALDRVDSMLVAALIGYYYTVWVMGVSLG
jgi:phosphatidate cytidylyltransferase